jgi:hypothetical protein
MRVSSFFLSLGERRSVLIADVRDLAFGAVLGGELEQVIVPGEEVDLAEGQVLVERGAYRAEQALGCRAAPRSTGFA